MPAGVASTRRAEFFWMTSNRSLDLGLAQCEVGAGHSIQSSIRIQTHHSRATGTIASTSTARL